MKGFTRVVLAAATMSALTACIDLNGASDTNTLVLGEAFQSVPAGFSANSNSFDPAGDRGEPFLPRDLAAGVSFHGGGPGPNDQRGHGFGDGGLRGLLMGGGLGPDYIGYLLFGKGKGRGPFGWFKLPDSCVFSVETGRVTCPEATKHGLTVRVSYAFADTEGEPQRRFDTLTTNSVNVQTAVSGTRTHREGAATTTVNHTSDRTISGLAPGNDERTVDGTAQASEVTDGIRDGIEFVARRDLSDTTRSLVIPVADGRPTIPSSGVVIRNMKVTITKEGEEPRAKSRREKITFDGTNVVKIEITQDDVTKNCTLTLPGKTLICE
jgi:hypothetical protein